jgi:2-amino-4-hydroxy-6-hydroxymethyldihydropteridine diphosphokinase
LTVRAYVGIGSNLAEPALNVRRALEALAEVGTVLRASSLYRTTPWGVTGQPDYVNAVVQIETALRPRALLDALKDLETRLGRTPAERWAARVIDFDILTYGDERVRDERLQIPHARMFERAFVLVPLAELDPAYAAARDALAPSELAAVRPL